MKLYLDNCCFNRPFDDQEQVRIRLEAEAKLEIQSRIKKGQLILAWSFMLENSQNVDALKEKEIARWADVAQDFFTGSTKTLELSLEIMGCGIKKKDAVHLACAIESECDYFLTTDDGILKRKDAIKQIVIINPVDFIILTESS
ncbi:MAG: PIN domain protein [Spirochaetae bacterium HGW-Spirochaetae-10]|nr:MAG: PIN domain protein [Spirochaetae bacterium HGW-Spirochaetae-10]